MADNNGVLQFSRRFRPANLSEYVGNEKAVEAIMRNLRSNNPAQTICFYGEPGCGKTSLARLVGKEYSCENRDKQEGACGVCPNCLEFEKYIASGKTEDLLVDSFITEVNVAVDRGVKDVEAIIEQASYPTFGNEWQIRIFDEFQMASPSAQSAMLKIIEEPPEKTLWIFCTTNPEQINKALFTRFQLKLPIKKPSAEDLVKIMVNIAKKENFLYDKRALSLIAARNDYIIRDSLNTLERIVTEKREVSYENTLEILQEVAEDVMFKFYDLLLNHNVLEFVRLIHTIKQKIEIKRFVEALINFTNRGIFILNDSDVDGLSEREMEAYRLLFSRFTVNQICILLHKLLDMQNNVGVETKLLMLGYEGLQEAQEQVGKKATLEKIDVIKELDMERQQSLKSVSEQDKLTVKEEENIVNSLIEEATTDQILAMFGDTISRSI